MKQDFLARFDKSSSFSVATAKTTPIDQILSAVYESTIPCAQNHAVVTKSNADQLMIGADHDNKAVPH